MSTSFNFPANPTLNQIVVLPDGNSAQWNGYAWVSVGDNVVYPLAVPKGGTGATNPLTAKRNLAVPIWTLDDAMPAAPVYGDRWVRPGSMTEVVWLPNANNAGVWVNLADVGSVVYPIPISKGGTGATTAAQARINLGINAATGEFIIPTDGTVAAPGLAWASEPGLGWYRPSAASRHFVTAGGIIESMSSSATDTFETVFPRSNAGNVQLTLMNNVSGNAAQNQFYFRNQGGASPNYIIGESLQGGATARQLNIGFPAGVNVNGPLTISGTTTLNPNAVLQWGSGGGQINLNSAQAFPAISMSPGGNQLIFVRSDNSMIYQVQSPTRNLMVVHGDGSGTDLVGALTNTGVVRASEFDTTSGFGLVFRNNFATEYIALGDPTYGAQFEMAFVHQSGVWAGIRFICSSGQYQFDASGQARATVTGPFAALVSDARVKERIEDYTDGLEEILALRPRVFSFRPDTGMDSTRRWISLIAQEAREAMPTIVGPASIDKMGDIALDDPLTVDSGPVTWALVNAVKTLHARLAALEHA